MSQRILTSSAITKPRMLGWWSASILLHAAALAGLYHLKPDLTLQSEHADSATSQQVQEVMAEAQAAQAESLTSRLDELDEVKLKLEAAADAKLKQYSENIKMPEVPAIDPNQSRQNIERAQAEAAAAQKNLSDQSPTQSLKQIEEAQSRAVAAQDERMRDLERSRNFDHEELIQQDRARQAQLEAQAAQTAASKVQLDASGETPEGKKVLDESRRAQEDITEAQGTVDNAQKNLDRLQAELTKAQAATQPATTLDEKAAKKAQQNLTKAADRVTKGKNDLAKARTNLETRKQKLGTASRGNSTSSANAAKAQANANESQARANQLQASVGTGKSGQNGSANPPRNLSEVYALAREKESELFDRYRELRAADLAMKREMSLSEALKLIDVPRPQRPDFDPNLLDGKTGTPDQMADAMKSVSSEIDSITSTARRLSDDSQARTASGNLNSAWVRQQTDATRQNDELALQDAGVIAKDLSSAMGGGTGNGTGASGGSGTGVGTGTGGTGAGGSGTGAGNGSGALGSGSGTGSSGSGRGGSVSKLSGELGQSLRQEATRDVRPIPGRRVGNNSVSIEPDRRAQWMFIDSWYLIGPWPNPGRAELNTRFPPETIVDLDASYITKANQRVSWKYHQAAKEMISPPGMKEYEIYYACSELWFDSPQDLWVAIGSDDQSQVWIEDHLIWKSSNAHKDWNVIEGFRKVHFKQGRNRVLVRLENGHGNGGFSLVVNLDPKFGPG